MTRLDRLICTRQQQRDSAAETLALARKRLEALAAAEEELTHQWRHDMGDAVGTEALTLTMLEAMDATRRFADRAVTAGQAEEQEAQTIAVESQRLLRQLEILRDRALQRQRQERRRREQKELDEVAARKRTLSLLTLAVLTLTMHGAGCEKAAPPPPTTVSEGTLKKEKEVAPRPEETFSAEELALLRKLRARREALLERERGVTANELAVVTARKRVNEMLQQIDQIQKKLQGKTRAPKVDLVEVLRGMNTRSAAAMLALMDPMSAAAALNQLPPEMVGKLLASMPPDSAAVLGARLGRLKPPPEAKRPRDVTSEPPPQGAAGPAVTKPAAPAQRPPAPTVRPRTRRGQARQAKPGQAKGSTTPTASSPPTTPGGPTAPREPTAPGVPTAAPPGRPTAASPAEPKKPIAPGKPDSPARPKAGKPDSPARPKAGKTSKSNKSSERNHGPASAD